MLFTISTRKTALETHCNVELEKFIDWANANKLSLNLDKTYFMFFSYTRFYDNYNFSICMSGVQLSLERSGMFLGVLLDSELKFSQHINHTCKKISKTIGILFRIRHFIPKKVALNLYYALAFPYLNYNILVWGSTFSTHLNPLLILQKRIIRIIDEIGYRDHTNQSFFSNSILKLPEIHKYSVALFVFKNFQLFDQNLSFHDHFTRQREDLRSTFYRTRKSQTSIKYTGPSIWNSIPPSIKHVTSELSFKRQLKRHFINGYSEDHI